MMPGCCDDPPADSVPLPAEEIAKRQNPGGSLRCQTGVVDASMPSPGRFDNHRYNADRASYLPLKK